MAFLPTLSLFLLAAAEDTVAAEAPAAEDTVDTEVTEEEEEELEEPTGAFQTCMEGRQWALDDAAAGNTLDAESTCDLISVEEALLYSADVAACCREEFNFNHICAGDAFTDVTDEAAGPDASENAVNGCVARYDEINYWNPGNWGTSWKRAKYNSCKKIFDAGYTVEKVPGLALCCIPRSAEADPEAEQDTDADTDAEESARRLTGEEEEEVVEEEEEEQAEVADLSPKSGQALRDAACGGSPVTPNNPDNNTPDKPDQTPVTPGESGASTFGFTALALMLVTA